MTKTSTNPAEPFVFPVDAPAESPSLPKSAAAEIPAACMSGKLEATNKHSTKHRAHEELFYTPCRTTNVIADMAQVP